jgi:pimeloyl-ACP methyl ester carboxylesterase
MKADPFRAPVCGQVTLDDGRQLAWYQFGEPLGNPVFYFHGFPGSGVEARWGHGTAASVGVRLIGLDRPGFGRSSFAADRTILGWADDVLAVANALDIAQFSVLGMSGGAPYALACTARMPERVTRAMVVSGLGPMPEGRVEPGMTLFNRAGLWLARRTWASWLLGAGRPIVGYVLRRHAGRVVAHLAHISGARDREALAVLGIGPVLEESFRCAVHDGARGMVAEAKLFAGFHGGWLDRVERPVHWYHGERDVIVPLVMARRAEAKLPRCSLQVYPDGGHFSVLAHHLSDVFGEKNEGRGP